MRKNPNRLAEWPRDITWPFVALAFTALSLLIAAFATEKLSGGSISLDQFLLLLFRRTGDLAQPLGPDWLRGAARDVTALGSYAVLISLAAVVAAFLALTGKHRQAAVIVVAVLGAIGANSLLKLGIARQRPDVLLHGVTVYTPSFPSGHAAASAGLYLTLVALLARTLSSHGPKIYLGATGLLLVVLIGASRIYLGVHYPTDILAGWLVGSVWSAVSWTLLMRLERA